MLEYFDTIWTFTSGIALGLIAGHYISTKIEGNLQYELGYNAGTALLWNIITRAAFESILNPSRDTKHQAPNCTSGPGQATEPKPL